MPSVDEIKQLLRQVRDPLLGRSVVELGFVDAVDAVDSGSDGGRVHVRLAVPALDYPTCDVLVRGVRDAVAGPVDVDVVPMDEDAIAALLQRLGRDASRQSPFTTGRTNARVLAIASGKGGVGKSSITTNLAVALAGMGAQVGALDADVWGFSLPRMLGVAEPPYAIGGGSEGLIVPPVAYGVRSVSMGFFVDEDKPVMWRGPMLHKAMEQFLVDVYWGELDYLLIDMPPGTGDISLSLAQMVPSAEVVVVTTPQPAAQRVAQRAGHMAEKVNHRVLGVVENMSWLDIPGGERRTIFGEGGGKLLADDLGVPLLGQVPLDEALREGADTGHPVTSTDPGSPAAVAIRAIAETIHAQKPKRIRRPQLRITPT